MPNDQMLGAAEKLLLRFVRQFRDLLPGDPIVLLMNVLRVTKETITYEEEHGRDYWQPPPVTMARLRGDCEDYAVLWFFVLFMLGWSVDGLRLARLDGEMGKHMVCLVRVNGEWQVLDNLASAVYPRDAITDELQVEYAAGGLRVDIDGDGRLDPVSGFSKKWSAVLLAMSEIPGAESLAPEFGDA